MYKLETNDNHRLITQCMDKTCDCSPDREKLRGELVQKLTNSPLSKDKVLSITRTKSGS